MSKIDLNHADLETLARLKGIGDKLAARIVDYRETVHPFDETIELAAVPGISERMVRELEDEITVEPAPTDEAGEGTDEAEVEGSVSAEEADVAEVTLPAPAPRLLEAEEEAGVTEAAAEAEAILPGEPPAAAPEMEDVEEKDDVRQEEVDATLVGEAIFAEEAVEERPSEREAEALRPREEVPLSPSSARPSFFSYLLAIFFGALLGAGLALLLLYAVNGTLNFARPAQITRLQSQIEAQEEGQSGLSEDLSSLSTQLDQAEAAEATIAAGLETVSDDLANLESEVDGDVAALETETELLATRVSGLSDAAENFDLFLDGVRDLLVDLRGLPPTPTATPTLTATATMTATTAAEDEMPTETPTPTPAATRTPRPTATPFASPTVTPVASPTATPENLP